MPSPFDYMLPEDQLDHLEDCYQCGGEGEIEVDCGEDSCCCAEPHAVIPCPMCSRWAASPPLEGTK